ncbi:MAG: 50S ribosomal protein L13 [Methanobacteriota archaeon]|nr:MAG: 50S ribosomal protein L13 [Euryarchaeota archaeon]
MLIIDAENAVTGRLATYVAKELLKGEEVHVINAEKAIISGEKRYTENKYKEKRDLKNKQDPERSPKYPRLPHLFVKKIIKGMLPRKKASGRAALKRLRVHSGNPLGKEGKKIEGVIASEMLRKYITIEELCKKLGWRGL